METDTIYVTVKVQITKGADPQDVGSEMDYSMTHSDIVSTEIVEVEEGE